MSKTVDELIGVYIEASNAVVWEAEKRGLCPMTLDMQRAGIAAVVSELMEHFVTGASTYAWDADDLHAEFMKILGDAGAEKVAGGSTREDEKAVEAAGDKGPVTVNSPATTPAPAVCEWTGEEYVTYSTSCESEHEVDPHKAPPKHCPSCGLPIKFTEAKT